MTLGGLQLPNLSTLSVEDRLALVDAIWDSILADRQPIPLTPAQQEEIVRRLEEHALHPDAVISWDELKRKWRHGE